MRMLSKAIRFNKGICRPKNRRDFYGLMICRRLAILVARVMFISSQANAEEEERNPSKNRKVIS